jgi:WD40 repeat protein
MAGCEGRSIQYLGARAYHLLSNPEDRTIVSTLTPIQPSTLTVKDVMLVTPTASEGQQNGPEVIPTEEAVIPIQGDIYILLRPVKPPFLLALARWPAACLISPDSCPPIELLYQDRNADQPILRQTDLVFSPDGNTIWWNNDYQQNIFSLDGVSKVIRPVAQNILAIRGDFQWSPDGRWVALAAQGNGPFDGQVMLIDSKTGGRQILLSTPNEIKFPVGWINNHELLVIVLGYGPPPDNPDGKWVENRQSLAVLDVASGKSREAMHDFLGVSSNSLSPDRQWLAYYQNDHGTPNLYLQSLVEDKKLDLKTEQELLGWSPDSQWIALRSSSGDVSVLHPDGTGEQKIAAFPGDMISLRWFIDNIRLLAREYRTKQDGTDEVVFSLISIQDGSVNPIELKGLNQELFIPDGIFWAGD